MEQHVRLLGILFVIWGIISLCFGIFLFALFIGGGILTGSEEAFAILTIIGIIVSCFSILTGIPEVIGGWGLLNKKSWARIVVIIMAVINVISPPFGTALGVYAFWVLFNPEATKSLRD